MKKAQKTTHKRGRQDAVAAALREALLLKDMGVISKEATAVLEQLLSEIESTKKGSKKHWCR